MAKSRGRKSHSNTRAVSRSGDPRRRAMAQKVAEQIDPVQRAAARVGGITAAVAPSDPMQLPTLLPLFIDMVATVNLAPAERCLDDCMTLVHAYAQLGIPAQVRAVELTVTNTSTKSSVTHGSLTPRWEDDMIHGHTVVWLPTLEHLVDVTAEQFAEIAALDDGPIIAGHRGPRLSGNAPISIKVKRKDLLLTYTLASMPTSAALLDHPVPHAEAENYRRRGINVASAAVKILASSLPPGSTRLIPHKRAAALVEAVRELPEHLTPTEDQRFLLPGPDGEHVVAQLDEIPLPPGTPLAAEPNS
ncbi:hypothetical protein ACFHYQ_05195 [Sphaerimonospora cavernae]|uniref:Uncharacterized protein n=1 Tax=Sphaerimonospora cavernae TaxID=1740611 RepID=A0ABV6TZS0_9ACTN